MTDLAAALRRFDLSKYEGWCMELVNDLLTEYPAGEILWVQPPAGERWLAGTLWKYHAAAVFDGLVYDAWNPDVRLPPREYVKAVFGDAEWELNPGSDDDD